MSNTVLGIGLAGFGTVGSGVWKILEEHGALIESRSQGSAAMEIRKIAVRDFSKKREGNAPAELFTTNLMEMVDNPMVDIVVELIGGTEAAFNLVTKSLRAGKPVITGNKAVSYTHLRATRPY